MNPLSTDLNPAGLNPKELSPIKQTLLQYFGFSEFRLGQEPVINAVVSGRSSAAIFPTGSGKSLCYQLPALHMPNLTLVISPLLALMQDQISFLNSKNIPAASIDSSLSREQVNQIMQDVRAGHIKILMVAVERLKNERFRHFLQSIAISLLVVDEAHCISEWGHNFRPDYLKLPQYQKDFNIPQALLLTATATPQVIEDMANKFNIQREDVTATGFYRPNLDLSVEAVSDKNKLFFLENWLLHEARYKPAFNHNIRDKKDRTASIEPTIVYVTLQQSAEVVAGSLAKAGFNAKAYHAGMNSEIRQVIQSDFMAGNTDIIVATIAFGMGIDKSNIRHVVHYDLPKSIENYSQEIGRAGRDGQKSDCLVLVNRDNISVLENFIYGDTPEYAGIEHVLQDINQNKQNGKWEFQLYTLSMEANIRQLPLKTLLVYLEIQGLIQPMYSYFAEYKFKLLVDEQVLLSQFNGERLSFVQAILQYSQRAKTWWTADIDAICQQYKTDNAINDRARVVKALEYFDEKGWIELQAKQITEVYRVNVEQINVAQQSQNLTSYFEQKQQGEVAKIHNMLQMFEQNKCITHQLATYFGDNQVPLQCGHCSVCAGHQVIIPQPVGRVPLEQTRVHQLAKEFVDHYYAKFSSQPSLVLTTRFLCGITTPIFTKLKARSINGFGQLAEYPYAEIQQMLSTNI
ncbi:ATP-dependent DNA helicase RecQ [Psychrosphaera saromensis]|uniref:ATP-dependent DNA helicase RecQ n=1 Tax=Psychrosphaera saromensis TaxID=716813 RepID=A0A2S7UUF0_9GAMM|nr:RecQ family ATP-dependent DNA helicase [Psychrosphaera saromensis]PQJ53563.1 recombinase RecQ [Psychrosphaera saromensis]GHB64276.1 ATP-dependent DNA helicase RecQ [Psychrosphaera saromensis]GLQ15680.1 ATP-dependent DNA helicase RecQ [Psychrosphaera saromensis]